MAEEQPPLLLCMENLQGEEVTLAISPNDDFNTFLAKSKTILGFDVDLNSVTKNHPVKLTDNIYQFLIQNEAKSDQDAPGQTLEEILEQSSTDLVYILDDGTQINASQIHFDNDDPFTDLTKETLPFVKYNDSVDFKDDQNIDEDQTTKINIVASPVVGQTSAFINSIPFKLICSNTSGFEAQFVKHLQGKTYTTLNTVVTKKSPKTLIKDNYTKYINEVQTSESLKPFSREDIVNMLKDSPVIIPNTYKEKRRHARKPMPNPMYKKPLKTYADLPYFPIGNVENQDCFICAKFVNNTMERLYIFDKEDQKIHKSSPQKRRLTQLKILCENCLELNFRQCPMETQNRQLNSDEYLIIRNNQQYIYQLIKPNCFNKALPKLPEVKVMEPVAEAVVAEKCSFEVKEEQIIDIEIIDQATDIDQVIENLEEADEDVKVFLGKYQKSVDKELVCRFCEQKFTSIDQVIQHGSVHKHDLDDGEVFPCPLCDYGYADFKWLKGHLKAAHEKSHLSNTENQESNDADKSENVTDKSDNATDKSEKIKETSDACDENTGDIDMNIEGIQSSATILSPIAKRTRSSIRKKTDDNDDSDTNENQEDNKENVDDNVGKSTTQTESHVISTVVKQECLNSDDDAIWIVHTDDSDLENGAKDSKHKKVDPYSHKCLNCNKLFINAESLTIHRCVKTRGNKRSSSSEEDIICIPSQEDFLKRAQGRAKKPKNTNEQNEPKKTEYSNSSECKFVTCHNCNESFSSKVRLKFHMQFHSPAASQLLTPDGHYVCTSPSCGARFPAERALFDHVHFRHAARRRWQCPLPTCRKTFRLRATLTKHSRVHTDTRRYACASCGKRFLDKQTLDEHSVTHLQTKPFQCHICLKQLTRRSRLRMHLRAHESLAPTALLVCVVCHRAFRNQEDAEEHAQTSSSCLYELANELKLGGESARLSPSSGHSTNNEPVLSRVIPRQASPSRAAALLRGLREPAKALARVALADRAFRCEYCEDVFYSEEGLNKHRVIHKGVKNPFTCHICKVSFATYSRCTTHKTTHGFYKRPAVPPGSEPGTSSQTILGYGDFPVAKHFLCEECGRSYLHWTYLQVHRRLKHGAAGSRRCRDCGLGFPNSWSVSYHRKKVHGKQNDEDENGDTKIAKTDYRIPCRDCDQFLPNKTALYKHRNKEHSDLSLLEVKSELFCCLSCGAQFNSRTAMVAHNMHCNSVPGTTGKHNTGNTSRLRSARRIKAVTEIRSKPETVLVMEFAGLDPSPEEIMARLNEYNVNLDKIIDINKISIPKGVKSVIPTTERALRFISNNQKSGRQLTNVQENESQTQTSISDEQTENPLVVIKTEQISSNNVPEENEDEVTLLLRDANSSVENAVLQFDESLL